MKRFLTPDEITQVLSDLKPIASIPPRTALSLMNTIRSKLAQNLSTIQIYPEQLPKLKLQIEQYYYSSQISPGECVGILAAQSIGEKQTQSTLNSFHSSGITCETVITGVPRFAELLSATKNPKAVITTVHFKQPPSSIQQLRNLCNHQFKYMVFRDVCLSYQVSAPVRDDWYDSYFDIYKIEENILDEYDTKITFYIDLNKLYTYRLSTTDISKQFINRVKDMYCIPSPTFKGILDVWISTLGIEDTTVYIQQVVIPALYNLPIGGIQGIEELFFKQDKQRMNWYLETLGSNLYSILALPDVDETESMCNNMWDIFKVFGIEATREFLVEEFTSIISSDSYINPCHIELLVDVMTYNGSISSISRYGVQRNQSGPLSKSSFEESLENFLKAGVYGDREDITGISAAIMLGKTSTIGTGLCEIRYS
jgi:DNA-directed RNA polymerase beta' subunit